MLDYRIISIGTLAAHPLWDEMSPVRTGHTTTTLIDADEAKILVNPGLPGPAVVARMSERTRIQPEEITHVFLTSFNLEHRRGLDVFGGAQWLLHEPELETAGALVQERLEEADEGGDEDLERHFSGALEVIRRFRAAPDSITRGVDLFPLPGVTAGCCGLLLALPGLTVLICGDALATPEHVEQGKVMPNCADREQALESFREAVEIADVLVPGRGNLMLNPLRRMM